MPTYSIASGHELWAGRDIGLPIVLPAVDSPTNSSDGGTPYRHFAGSFDIDSKPYYTAAAADLPAGYSTRPTWVNGGRILIYLHGSGSALTSVNNAYAPGAGSDVEIHIGDAEYVNATTQREWHIAGPDGVNYTGRRIVAMIRWLMQRYPSIDLSKGIIFEGNSLGMGGSIMQCLILPSPWRERIAYIAGDIGACLPRYQNTTKYTNWPSLAANPAFWDSIDYEIHAPVDPVVRGIHFRHRFGSNDLNYDHPTSGLSTQLPWVNWLEAQFISAVATWVANGHSATEPGVVFPDIRSWQGEQGVTLDRAHPCFTASTGNYPDNATDRLNQAVYPRGHYNLGLIWQWSGIVDTTAEIIFPIRYLRSTGIGGGVPDMPTDITVSVTPRRPKRFTLVNGETVFWSFDGGALTGSGTVVNGVITASGIPLTSGAAFKSLRFFKA